MPESGWVRSPVVVDLADLGDIDAVVLDAGGVLLLPDPDALRSAMAPFGVTPTDEQCRRSHYEGNAEVDRLGVTDWRLVDLALVAVLGVAAGEAEAAAAAVEPVYIATPWIPIAGVAEALRELAAAGVALAIVSNAEGTMEEMLAEHRICSVSGGEAARVAVVVDSALVGVAKPDPEIFAFALDPLGIPAERCLYVGDTVHFDVNGARAAGLHPLHLDPYGLCPGGADHGHITGLDELVRALVARVKA